MRPKILTYVPPSRGRKKRKNIVGIIAGRTNRKPGTNKWDTQYRRRRLPYLSPDLKWMCLWMALLLGLTVVMSVVDRGSL